MNEAIVAVVEPAHLLYIVINIIQRIICIEFHTISVYMYICSNAIMCMSIATCWLNFYNNIHRYIKLIVETNVYQLF